MRRVFHIAGGLWLMLWAGCATAPDEAEFMSRAFPAGTLQPAFHEVAVEDRPVHYAEIGDPDLPPVIFVHGTPGSWKAFAHYLRDPELQALSYMVSVDRPGFGQSGFGQVETSLQRHAAYLEPLLDLDRTGRGAILVGHSYGGPIVARMAMEYADRVRGLVLVAASVDPEQEDLRWYHLMAKTPPVRWAIPRALNIANKEILPLKGELKEMLPYWKDITVPVVVIQGGKDKLVRPGNAEFLEHALVNAPVTVQYDAEWSHFIPWSRPELIKEAILELLAQTQ